MSRPPQSNDPPTPAPDDPVAFTTVEFTAAGQLRDETLAAWLDDPDAFRAADADHIRTHLRQDAASRAALDDLHLVVAALGSLPEFTPTRSFALSAQSAHAARPVVTTRPAPRPLAPVVQLRESNAWQVRQQRTLRWASAVAAMLLVFVLSVDAFSGDRSSDTTASKDEAITIREAAAPAGGNAEFIPPSADQSSTSEGYGDSPAADTGETAATTRTPAAAAMTKPRATWPPLTATPPGPDWRAGMADETTVPGQLLATKRRWTWAATPRRLQQTPCSQPPNSCPHHQQQATRLPTRASCNCWSSDWHSSRSGC